MERPRVIARGLLWGLVDVSLADPADLVDDGRPTEPRLAPLMGADPAWDPPHEDQTPGGCSICGAGIREGHPWICLGCGSVSPSNARRIRFCRPRKPREKRVPGGPNRLRRKERLALLRCPEGPPCLALIDARDAGDRDRASRIELAFACYQAGEITLAELHARAGTTPRTDPRTAAREARPR